MRKQQIGEAAGVVWKLLAKEGKVNVAILPKTLRLEPDLVQQTLGWLAREDKIEFKQEKKILFVGLTESELRHYQSSPVYFTPNVGSK